MNDPDAPPADPPERLAREAAEWFARMRGPSATAFQAEFEAWLGQSAAHRSAYNRAAEIFAMGKLLADRKAPPPRRQRRPLALALTACVACALAGGGWLALRPAADGPRRAAATAAAEQRTLSTVAGEVRMVRLADGSGVQLGAGTLLETAFDAGRRTIRLWRGQARFEVAHEGRPFVVLAGGGSVTARGTVFDVAVADGRRIEVRLLEGAVDVALPATASKAGRPEVRRLAAGESLSFVPAPAAFRAASPAVAARDFEAVPVAVLVAEANRGAARPIRLADTTLADQRVSGRFRVDDTELLAQRLAALFGRTADLSDPHEIVLRQ